MRRELKLNSFRDLEQEIEKIEKAVGLKTTGVWSVYQILQHLTDMLHGSMHGFPKHQPKIVRMTVGKYIYKKIMKSGIMRQGYPNASAPAKREDAPIGPAIQRLRAMITEFENFNGHTAMHPFFDRLNKEEWTKLHLIHFALHLSFITGFENSTIEESVSKTEESVNRTEETESVSETAEESPLTETKEEVKDSLPEEHEESVRVQEEIIEVKEEVEVEIASPEDNLPPSPSDETPEPVAKVNSPASKKTVSKKQASVAKKKEPEVKKESASKKKEPIAKKKSETISKKKEPIAKKKTAQAPPAKKKPASKKK